MQGFLGTCCGLVLVLFVIATSGQATKIRTAAYRLDSADGLELFDANARIVDYRGRRALHLAPEKNHGADPGSMIALVAGSNFHDGMIEVDVAGKPILTMDATARGFIGVQFRAHEHGLKTEDIYLRPTNGRADDQLRRNHSVQYESLPDFPWHRLRDEQPGMYESYADLEAGAWTRMKIEVAGTKAKLYVNGAEQPCLIVNDLRLGDSRGQVGLWAFVATDAYFSNLKIEYAD